MDNSIQTEPVAEAPNAMTEVAQSRVAQEVQAAMVIARKFPRDHNAAHVRIMQACKRKSLAEQSMYAYPRGGTIVTGPSIRMAEVLAQNWGNLDFGIVEIEQRQGESTVMAYCWDLETNVRQTKIFNVPHARYTRNAGLKSLTDPRDIYEMTANQGARRLRTCILGVIPGDVVEEACEQCNTTMKEGHEKPRGARIKIMATAFDDIGVTIEMIEKRLGHKLDVTNEQELVNLQAIYRSIKDNMQAAKDFFPTDGNGKSVKDKVKDAVKAKPAKTKKGSGKKDGNGQDKEDEKRGPDYINGKQNRLLWFEAGKRALEVYKDKQEGRGIIDALLAQHEIEMDPQDKEGRPSPMMIPWKKFDEILNAVKAWEADAPDAAAAQNEDVDF